MSAESVVSQLLGVEAVTAVQAVAEAAWLVKWIHREALVGRLRKSDGSVVTVADYAAQALIAGRLTTAFPGVPLVAEEDATALRGEPAARLRATVVDLVGRFGPDVDAAGVLELIDAGRGTPSGTFWTLDPVDGTSGLLRDGQFAVALALIRDGTVELGVLGCPRLSFHGARSPLSAGDLYGTGGIAIALRNRGAWWSVPLAEEMTRLSVSMEGDAAQARVLRSLERSHDDGITLERILRAFGSTAAPIGMDSQAKHVVLAAGRADLLLRVPGSGHIHESIWDQAAGTLLIEEAGGRVTDLCGRPLDFSVGRRLLRNDGVVASNGRLHDTLLAALDAAGVHRSDGNWCAHTAGEAAGGVPAAEGGCRDAL